MRARILLSLIGLIGSVLLLVFVASSGHPWLASFWAVMAVLNLCSLGNAVDAALGGDDEAVTA